MTTGSMMKVSYKSVKKINKGNKLKLCEWLEHIKNDTGCVNIKSVPYYEKSAAASIAIQ